MTSISVIIPWLTDDGHRDRLLDWVLRRYAAILPDAQVVLGENKDWPFNRGAARNDAAARADHDVFLIADADTTFPDVGCIRWAAEAVRSGLAPWVIPYAENRYYNLTRGATEHLLSMAPDIEMAEDPRNEAAWDHKITSWAGLLVMTREAFETVGGYDERFLGWGYEDNAFRLAMDTLVGAHRRLNSSCVHLWHPTHPESNFEQPHIQQNRALFTRYERASGRPELMRDIVGAER